MTSTDIANASNIMLGTTQASAMYIGDTLVWEYSGGGGGRLPKGYTELEYIASTKTGGQYIDLNILLYDVLNKNYDIAMKFRAIGAGQDNTTQSTIFGCQDNTGSPWPGTFIRVGSSDMVGRYIGGSDKDNTIGAVGSDIELTEKTPPAKNVYNYNNSGRTHTWGTSLFCIFNNLAKTARIRYIEARLYYFKLFVEGVLVRDMVPCIDPNNVVGLYDLVNDVFYSSPNGAAFVAGPVVNNSHSTNNSYSTTNGYISNGLIFYLDGIDKGSGSDWTDLIGGILFSKIGTGCTSTSNSWNFPGNSGDYLVSADNAWSSVGGSDDFTVEVCYNNLRSTTRTFLFSFGGSLSSKYPIFYHTDTYITWIQGGYTYNASSMTGNSKNTVSINNDSGLVNGLLILKTSSTDYWSVGHTNIRIGLAYTGAAAAVPTNGDIYSIRIYNRKLSQSELLQNQTVDNNRFNLGLSI